MRIELILKNFLNTLHRYFTSSLLNILGLGVALASLYVILVQVRYDFSYNKEIKNAHLIFRMENRSDYIQAQYDCWLNRPVPERIIKEVPLIEAGGTGYLPAEQTDICIPLEGGGLRQGNAYSSQWSLPLLDIMGCEPWEGNLQEAARPGTVIVSRSFAGRYGLKTGDVIYYGSTVADEKAARTIAAIFTDFPANSDPGRTEIISDMGETGMNIPSQWGYNYYLKLRSPSDVPLVEERIRNIIYQILKEEGNTEEEIKKEMEQYQIRLTCFRDTYFTDDVMDPPGNTGNLTTTYTLLGVALLVVLIAFINFINFFFALVPRRIRSVNTFKIFGSGTASLRANFIFEALGLVIIALLLAGVLVTVLEKWVLGGYISATLEFGKNMPVLLVTVGSALLLALLSSVYPAYYITSFSPAFVIKGSFGASRQGQYLRYALVGLQFVISISLIIVSLFIRLQHSYMMNYDMGFDKENLLTTWVSPSIAAGSREAFTDKLTQNPQIVGVAYAAGNIVAETRMGWGRDFKGRQINFHSYPVSYNFLEFMGIKISGGRNFTRADELKENGTFIFNEKARKEFELTLEDKVNGHRKATDIAGFCEDFNFKPLQYATEPFAFYVFGAHPWQMPRHVYIRTTAGADIESLSRYIIDTILEFDPQMVREKIRVQDFGQELGIEYEKEKKLTLLITLFTFLSIIISLMGVFGLVLFETQYRRREIGIRKVHGATIGEILMMFNGKFIKIVFVCFLIALPVSYFAIRMWLSTFAYHIRMYGWVFAVALSAVLIITVLIVTVRSLGAASENPAESVKID